VGRSRRLAAVKRADVDQGLAEIAADPDRPDGWTLFVNGTPQSHVNLADPTDLEFEYIGWLGHLVDVLTPSQLVHLGGGAWTLARYVAAVIPSARQRVVEVDGRLVDFVRASLPSAAPGVRVRVGDAREVLATLRDGSADLIVADVYTGARIPPHLSTVEFMTDVARVLRPDGVFAANIADGGHLHYLRGLAATLGSVLPEVAVVAPPQVIRGRHFGNTLLLGSPAAGRLPLLDLARLLAGDPFPARVTAGDDLVRFVAGAPVVTDAAPVASPRPPDFLSG
jgi:spermidine synthase